MFFQTFCQIFLFNIYFWHSFLFLMIKSLLPDVFMMKKAVTTSWKRYLRLIMTKHPIFFRSIVCSPTGFRRWILCLSEHCFVRWRSVSQLPFYSLQEFRPDEQFYVHVSKDGHALEFSTSWPSSTINSNIVHSTWLLLKKPNVLRSTIQSKLVLNSFWSFTGRLALTKLSLFIR